MIRCAWFVALAFAFLPLAVGQEKKEERKDELKLTKEEEEVINLTNAERKNAELPPLKMNAKLMAAARGHAANMAKQDKLEHTLDEKTARDRLKDAGYKYRQIGENIAWGAEKAKQVVEGWMESPIHKENILTPEFTEIGVGVAKNEKGDLYWVQVFGTGLR